MTEITKPSRRIKLWRLLIAITVVGVALAILPNQLVAVMILVFIEGALLVALLFLPISAILKKLAKR